MAKNSSVIMSDPIAIVINGVPRSGKSSLASELIASSAPCWVNLGVDSTIGQTVEHLLPGIGLRPGGERPDLEPFVLSSYQQLFDQVADSLRSGVSVVVDVGIHDGYTQPLDVLGEMEARLGDYPLLFVGLHCSLGVLRERRAATGYLSWELGEPVPAPVLRWQQAVHDNKTYDLELDSSSMTSTECATTIRDHLHSID